MTTSYFDDLAARLRDSGVSEKEVAGTVDDLAAYVAESGTDPHEEFGTPEEFAAQLVRAGDEPPPASSAETWLWTADAFQEVSLLNLFGDEGWEVERIDSIGRFVSHRDSERPQRWEYRRETVLPRRRNAVADRLAPDGWERCGTWLFYEYFKRPKAASLGPEAELGRAPKTPSRRIYWSKRLYVFLGCYFGALAVLCAAWLAFAPGDRTAFLTGLLAGAVIGAAFVVAVQLRARRDRSR